MHEGTTILGLLFMTVYSTSVILQSLAVFSMLNSGYLVRKNVNYDRIKDFVISMYLRKQRYIQTNFIYPSTFI